MTVRSSTLATLFILAAAGVAPATAQTPGFAPERRARVDSVLQQYVDDGRIAGAVALVLQDGRPVYERAVGWSDRDAVREAGPRPRGRIRLVYRR